MRRIALFLLSSILTPATLASGQATCLLATQIKIMTPLPADNSITGWTVISNSSGSCVVRPVDVPLRPAASTQTIAPPVTTKKRNIAAVMEILISKLGWDESTVSATPAGLRMKEGGSGGSHVAESVDSSQRSFSAERAENAVVRF